MRWLRFWLSASATRALKATMPSSWVSSEVGSVIARDRETARGVIAELREMAAAARSVANEGAEDPPPSVCDEGSLGVEALEAFRAVEAALGRSSWLTVRDALSADARRGKLAVAAACCVTLDKALTTSQHARAAVSAITQVAEGDGGRGVAKRLVAKGYEVLGPRGFDARSAAAICRAVMDHHQEDDVDEFEDSVFFEAVRGVVDVALDDDDDSNGASLAAAASLVAAIAPPGGRLERGAELVRRCAEVDLWQSAEEVTAATRDSEAATELVEAALRRRRPRQADVFAKRFVDLLGDDDVISRAAFQHAKSTLEKVTTRRQISLVDKVVRSVDSRRNVDAARKRAVKAYALECLRRTGEYEAARRLCETWSLALDEGDVERAEADAERRRLAYLQWSDTPFAAASPSVVGSRDNGDLRAAVAAFLAATPTGSVVGVDVEWGDDAEDPALALLQLASATSLLLVDAAAVIADRRVQDARACLAAVFDRDNFVLVGFAPKQDRRRLFAAGLVDRDLTIIDLQPLAAAAATTTSGGTAEDDSRPEEEGTTTKTKTKTKEKKKKRRRRRRRRPPASPPSPTASSASPSTSPSSAAAG